jgi:hypothetical protein
MGKIEWIRVWEVERGRISDIVVIAVTCRRELEEHINAENVRQGGVHQL